MKTPSRPSSTSPEDSELAPGLKHSRTAIFPRSEDIRVTRANFLAADRGSPNEKDLDSETEAMLDRNFPEET
jgi:hypothetical protein